MLALKILLITAVLGAVGSAKKSCELSISSKRRNYLQWPLVFQPDGELFPTTTNDEDETKVQVPDSAEVLLSCAPNYLKHLGRTETLNVRCDGVSGQFKADSVPKEITEYSCDLRVVEAVLVDVDGCVNAQASRFGYVNPTDKLTHILGEACYDETERRTRFAHVKLGEDGYLEKVQKNYLTEHKHPSDRFKTELFRELHFDEIYERLRQQLGNPQAVPHFKLANYIDDPLLSNAQYQSIKKLAWNYYVAVDDLPALQTLKNDIKQLSANQQFDVYVGSSGVKTLQGSNGKKFELYLQDRRHPVPEFLWFIVRHQQKASAFIVRNDTPNVVHGNVAEPQTNKICNSNCARVSWLSSSLRQSGDDAIVCCSYDELKNALVEVPSLNDINGLFL